MKKQMSKKQAIDLFALLTMISVSTNGEQVIEAIGLTEEQTDKMMRVVVGSFENDEKKANQFIVSRVKKLLKTLENHEIDESQIKYFERVENKNENT